MTALAHALLATACLAGVLVGSRLLRSTPGGVAPLVAREEILRRPSLIVRLQQAAGRRFAPTVLAAMSPRRRDFVQHRLDAAGRPDGMDLRAYAARKAGVTALCVAIGAVLMLLTGSPLLILALALGGWLSVDLKLSGQAKRRQRQIDRDLPDFLDVLTVTVGAGLGFRNALARVSEELPGPLSEEVRTVLRQLSLGATRRAAFQGLDQRNDSETLGQFVTALLQAEELGTPLGDTLTTIAADMRREFGQRARRQAARAEPRVSLVVTMVIVPGGVALMLGALFFGSGFDLGTFGG